MYVSFQHFLIRKRSNPISSTLFLKISAPGLFGHILKVYKLPMRQKLRGLIFGGTKFLGAQTSRGPNFLGPKNVRGPDGVGDHFSYSQRFSITDSVHELTIGHRRRISMPKFEQKRSSLVIIVAQISTTAAAAIEHHMQP